MNIRLSSFKRDHGLKELLSPDVSEFWSTDGNLPHFVKLSFKKRTYVDHIQFVLSYFKDDSYTPEKIDVFAGDTTDTIERVFSLSLFEPEGAVLLMVKNYVFYIYAVISANHQEGRDSHIRYLKVVGKNNEEIVPNLH